MFETCQNTQTADLFPPAYVKFSCRAAARLRKFSLIGGNISHRWHSANVQTKPKLDILAKEVRVVNKILIAEDEAPIANLIRTALEGAGYRCVWAPDGANAADKLEAQPFDLALLDIMLPKADGYEVLEYCKSLEVPVIFLTAKGELEDRVKGLRLGAEDYIVKPFELMELLARVETVLRRCGKTGRVLTLPPDIEVDTASHVVRRGGVPVALTSKEYDLLLLFLQNKNIALYRDRIYEKVWGEEFLGDSRTVDLHIQRMRKKLGLESRLVAVYKVGYRLEV